MSLSQKRMHEMFLHEDDIQTELNRGYNFIRIAKALSLDRKDVSEFIQYRGLKPWPQLSVRIVSANSIAHAQGHLDGTPERGPVMFRKNDGGWYVILSAQQVIAYQATEAALQESEKELVKLREEIEGMKVLVSQHMRGGKYELDG